MPTPLPLELHIDIIRRAPDLSTLKSLALTCIAFQNEAQSILFRHAAPNNPRSQTSFLSVINHNADRLGAMVHKFYVLPPHSTFAESHRNRLRDMATNALRYMPHLTHLWIESSDCIALDGLMECPFYLRLLVWGPELSARDSSLRSTRNELPHLLFDFLRTQPSIQHLRINDPPDEDIDKAAFRDDLSWCPNLETLGSNVKLLDLLPAAHRHIWYLDSWLFTDIGFRATPQPPNFAHVTHFTLSSVNYRGNYQILDAMQSLDLLDIRLTWNLSVSIAGDVSNQLRFLHRKLTLTRLILDYTASPYSAMANPPDFADVAFGMQPTLQDIYIRVENPLDQNYHHFGHPDLIADLTSAIVPHSDVYGWKVGVKADL